MTRYACSRTLEISWCKIALGEFQDVLEGAKCQDGVVLRGLAADWYVKSDRYILAYLAKIDSRLPHILESHGLRQLRITRVCNLLNKFLTVIQTDFRFHAKCHSEAEMIFKWRVFRNSSEEPHSYSWKLTVEQYLIKNVEDNYQWWHYYKWVPWRQQNSSISDNNERWAPGSWGSDHCWQIHTWVLSSSPRWNIEILERSKYHSGNDNDHKVYISRQQTFTLIAYKYAASSEMANHNLSPVVSLVRVSPLLHISFNISIPVPLHRNAYTEHVTSLW